MEAGKRWNGRSEVAGLELGGRNEKGRENNVIFHSFVWFMILGGKISKKLIFLRIFNLITCLLSFLFFSKFLKIALGDKA